MLQWISGFLILVLFIYLIESAYGWNTVVRESENMFRHSLALVILLIGSSYVFRTFRVYMHFKLDRKSLFISTLRVVLFHNLLNNLLPMRSGELSFPMLVRKYFNLPLERSISALLWFRVLDLYVLSGIAMVTVLWAELHAVFILLLLSIYATLPFIIFRVRKSLEKRFENKRSRMGQYVFRALAGLPNHAGDALKTLFWTVLNWSSKLIAYGWILAIIADTKLSYGILGSVTGELSSVLPFHGIGGAGTYEAGVLASLIPLGITVETAIRAAVNLHLFVLIISLLAAVLILPFGQMRKTK